jgi:hypothetical protein
MKIKRIQNPFNAQYGKEKLEELLNLSDNLLLIPFFRLTKKRATLNSLERIEKTISNKKIGEILKAKITNCLIIPSSKKSLFKKEIN